MFLDDVKQQLIKENSLFIGETTAFRSAVLIPLVEVEGEWHILFEVRAYTMRSQPGDISFPGGRIDPMDASPVAAALRETNEELGVDSKMINVLGKLSPYVVSPSFVVYPFVASMNLNDVIHSYNKDEVEEVFTIPVKWLLDYEPYVHAVSVESVPAVNFPYDKIMNGDQYQWRSRSLEQWFFDYGEHTIWGLTARILKHFIEILNQRKS